MSELNDMNFSSFFQDIILDNNNIAVTDINAGLVNLYKKYNEYEKNFSTDQSYLVSDFEEGYPDLVAMHSLFGSQESWWWFCLLNRLENPMIDVKSNWIYSTTYINDVATFVNSTNQSNSESNKRIGSVLELN